MNKIVDFPVKVVNFLVKKKMKIAFASTPDYSGNPKFLFEFLMKKKTCNFDFIWIVKDKSLVNFFRSNNIAAVYAHSSSGKKEIVTSKVIVTSHREALGISSKKQVYVDLWHGMPLKRMAFLDPFSTERELKKLEKDSKNIDISISTSHLMSSMLAACSHLYGKKIFITGQPRCDGLFSPVQTNILDNILNTGSLAYKYVLFYLPTFRVRKGRKEGLEIKENVFRFSDFSRDDFFKFLEKNKILFVFKPHPFEEIIYKDYLSSSNSCYFRLLTTETLRKNLIDVYDLLGISDLLITDYSSVYFDFLLLDRPLIFIPSDIEYYREKRGFLMEPYDFWTPGPKVKSQYDLQNEILKCLSDQNYYRKERKVVNSIINYFVDNKSSERVWNLIQSKLKGDDFVC